MEDFNKKHPDSSCVFFDEVQLLIACAVKGENRQTNRLSFFKDAKVSVLFVITTTTSLPSCHHQYCQCSHRHRHRHHYPPPPRLHRHRSCHRHHQSLMFSDGWIGPGGLFSRVHANCSVQIFRGSLPILPQERDHSNFFFQPTFLGIPSRTGERMTDLSQLFSCHYLVLVVCSSDDVVSESHRKHGCDRLAGSSKVWGLLLRPMPSVQVQKVESSRCFVKLS